jgi:hypothetical protein
LLPKEDEQSISSESMYPGPEIGVAETEGVMEDDGTESDQEEAPRPSGPLSTVRDQERRRG